MDKKCEELLGDSVINNRYPNKAKPVSYTHLTLPTILLV